MLFIVIHQVYELWFKLLLHELDKIARDFAANDLFGAIATFKRVRTIMKTLVGQLDILETMTPMSFSGFRDRSTPPRASSRSSSASSSSSSGSSGPTLLRTVEPHGPERTRTSSGACASPRSSITSTTSSSIEA